MPYRNSKKNSRTSPKLQFSEKQASFLTLLASGVPEEEAARQIWSEQWARKKLYKKRSPEMAEAVRNIKDGIAVTSQITREDVMDGFKEAANLARLKEDPMAVIAAFREIGKMIGCYEPQVTRVEHQLVNLGEWDKLSDKKLLELAGEKEPITITAEDYELVDVDVPDDDDITDVR